MYPMLTKENKILGLEPVDLLVLAVVYLVLFLISKNFIVNFALLLASYSFLASYKKKKAPHYTRSFVRFLLLPSRYTQAWEEDL